MISKEVFIKTMERLESLNKRMEPLEEAKKTGIISEWKGVLIGNCFNCLHAEDGSKIGKDGWLNCPKWGAANIDPYGFCHMWEQKSK